MARASKGPVAGAQLSFAEAVRPRGPELLVLPDGPRVEEHLLRTAEGAPSHLALGRFVCTVAQLERALVRAARGKLRIASPLSLELIYRRIARERTPRGSPWFAVRDTKGFAQALRGLAAALGQGMLSPADLLALVPQLEMNAQRRLLPLARLLEDARSDLESAGLCDPASALLHALGVLRNAGELPTRLRAISSLRFESILDWPPLRLEMLFALSERLGQESARARVVVMLPLAPERNRSDDPLAPVLQAIERRGATARTAVPELVFKPIAGEGPLAHFRARLFRDAGDLPAPASERASPIDEQSRPIDEHSRLNDDQSSPSAEHSNPSDQPSRPLAQADVALISCASPAHEAREAARRCADLLDAGAAPDSIAVAVRDLSGGAAEELGLAFDRLGISFRERRGRPALTAPPVQLALSLYELLERDFPREALLALLSSRQIWLRAKGERAAPEAIARWLRAARVRDDREEDSKRAREDRDGARPSGAGAIDAQLGLLSSRLAEQAAHETRAGLREGLERDGREVLEVRQRCSRAIAAVRTLPAQATLLEHGRALLDLLQRWELRERAARFREAKDEPRPIAGEADSLSRGGELARQRDLAGMDALEDACARLAQASQETKQERAVFSRTAWAELLASALEEISLQPPGARGAAVQLVELRELPGRSFAHLIVTGLVDGVLPARAAIDPLLSEEEKRALNRGAARAVFRAAASPRDPHSREGESPVLIAALPSRQTEEPLLFQLALASARDSIRLVWPRADRRGREAPRSTFADEAARALGLGPSDGEPLSQAIAGRIFRAPLSAIPPLHACKSPDELLARASLDAIADPAFRALAPAAPGEGRALLAALARSPLREQLFKAARSSLAERERLGAFIGSRAPGRFSGQLGERATAAARPLFAYGRDAPISASALEEDARCAFRVFGHRVLRVPDEAAFADDLSSRDRGTLMHRCLEAFYSAAREEGRLPLRESRSSWAEALREIAVREMDQFSRANDVGHRGLWSLRRLELLRLLEEVVASDVEQGANPIELEREFGVDSKESWPPLPIPSPDGSEQIFVRGAIDRIDRIAGQGPGALLIIDYKHGRRDILQRKLRPGSLFAPEFQLALYAAVVRAQNPGHSIDAAFLSLRDAKRTQTLQTALGKGERSLDQIVELDPARRQMQASDAAPEKTAAANINLADEAWKRVSRLRRGLFPVESIDCERCNLKPVCRIAALPVDEEQLKGGAG